MKNEDIGEYKHINKFLKFFFSMFPNEKDSAYVPTPEVRFSLHWPEGKTEQIEALLP